jgi:integrase/recombinase XerD
MNTLREAVGEYLDMRRGLGFKLREAGKGLIDFVTFLEQRNASYITQPLALTWAQQPSNAQPAYWAQRLSFVREFARFRSATDPRTQIPLQGLLPFQPKRARPYLYSDEEICSLLRARKQGHVGRIRQPQHDNFTIWPVDLWPERKARRIPLEASNMVWSLV